MFVYCTVIAVSCSTEDSDFLRRAGLLNIDHRSQIMDHHETLVMVEIAGRWIGASAEKREDPKWSSCKCLSMETGA